jgi:threonine/homoserine/homoserine lactone efflux protein
MPALSSIALFCLASVALAVVPGPAVTYIVTHSIDKGRRAGIVSACGIASGGLVHVVAATVGLSALIASSATAFTAVKLVGAAYLVAVGIRRILSREEDGEIQSVPAPHRELYVQGVVVNVLNPKTALFFLAFLPQFVDPARGAIWPQVAFLGILFALIAFASDVSYALLADLLAAKLRRSGGGAKARRWVTGGIFVAHGAVAATAHRVS